MKEMKKYIGCSAVALAMAALLPSCALDEPFGDAGEGTLTITTEMRGDVKTVTRALGSDELATLNKNCVIYIENSKGVIKKWKGVENIPQNVSLKVGSYVAEAWSGDSVSASFDKKFYRGYEKFEIGEGSNALTLKCNIANVLVSVTPESLNVGLSDMKVTFSHSRGELAFDRNNIADAKGYFMMPNADSDLSYKIEGRQSDGSSYVKEGKISNVQRAHEYRLNVSADDKEVTDGGALIRISIADIPVIEEDVDIFAAPVIRGVGYEIADQVVSADKNFNDVRVYVRGYFGLTSLVADFSSNFPGMTSGQNMLENSVLTALRDKGIVVERSESEDAAASQRNGKVKVEEVYVTFTKAFLDALPDSNEEFVVTFAATDEQSKTGLGKLRIANNEAAIERLDPVGMASAPNPALEPMAILAHTATLKGFVYDASAQNYGVRYRVQGSDAWTNVYADATRASAVSEFSVKLIGLEAGTTYEYSAICDGFESKDIKTFTTESKFALYNSSFEMWSTYSAKTLLGTKSVIFPGSGERDSNPFWETGNEGAATANMTLTDKSTDMVHSGTYSARLESKSALGMLAAGNLFVGSYVKTDGTNGVLSLGRPYNGSHPEKVRVYANYRPGISVSVKSGNEEFLPSGFASGNDHGQIYVALTTEAVEVRTNPSNRKLFNADDECVVAYGEVTWTGNFGPDGSLELVEIPFVYNERANTKQPTHVVIVCAASKYGDYFSGSAGSVMYLDDFELVY